MGPGGPHISRSGLPGYPASNAQLASLPPNTLPPGSRPISQGQVIMNGLLPAGTQQGPNGQVNLRGNGIVPQAQMQSYLQGQQRLPSQVGPDNARIIMEASRLSEQQRLMQQRQYQAQGQPNGINGLSSSHNSGNLGLQQQQANVTHVANLQAASGKPSPSANGNSSYSRSSTSPSVSATTQTQHLSGGMVPILNQITNQIKAMNPQATNEQVKQMATASLNQHLRSQNQMPAAHNMGLNGSMQQLSPQQQQQALAYNANIMNPQMNSQMYAQYMRSQQASQQTRNMGGDGRPESRGTPTHVKSGSNGGGSSGNGNGNGNGNSNGTSQSPRPPQAQMAGTT